MADTNGVIPIKDIVDGFLFKSKMQRSEYFRLYQLACDGYRDLNLFITGDGGRLVKLTMNANKIVDLPVDYLSFVKLAVPIQGKLYTLTRDEGIITTTTEVNGQETLDVDYGEGVEINPLYGYSYGAKGGRNVEGYYKVDEAKRRIVFRNVDRSEVFLEYISSGLSLTEQTLVPVISKIAIEAYMAWSLNRWNPNQPISRQQVLKEEWEYEQGRLRGLTMPTIKELEDAYYKEINQTARR